MISVYRKVSKRVRNFSELSGTFQNFPKFIGTFRKVPYSFGLFPINKNKYQNTLQNTPKTLFYQKKRSSFRKKSLICFQQFVRMSDSVLQVPGFTDLTLNDQMKLLQSSWTEVENKFCYFSTQTSPLPGADPDPGPPLPPQAGQPQLCFRLLSLSDRMRSFWTGTLL